MVMFFGMSNSPTTFSRMMTTIFREMIQAGTLVNYMDDFAIPGKTKQELEERTIRFLNIADKHNLYFKQSKCEFDVEKISILGTVIGNGEVRMEEEKIEAIKKLESSDQRGRSREFPRICKFLSMIHQELQHHSRATKSVEREG
jgi:hypothetical protein